MKYKLFLIALFYVSLGHAAGLAAERQMQLSSPDSRLKVGVAIAEDIRYSVSFKNQPVLLPSGISITLEKLTLGKEPKIKKTASRKTPDFNELTISFEDSFTLVFRAYNEGVAYRFITSLEGSVKVISEQADFNLAGKPSAILQQTETYTTWEGPLC
jgi:alpha-glucosidase